MRAALSGPSSYRVCRRAWCDIGNCFREWTQGRAIRPPFFSVLRRAPIRRHLDRHGGPLQDRCSEQEANVTLVLFRGGREYPEGEPVSVTGLRRNIHEIERIIALTVWWSEHRTSFRDAWGAILGQKQADGSFPPKSVEGELQVIEEALAKAEPLDEISQYLISAANAPESWAVIRREQEIREAISKSIEPLKDLRVLVGAPKL